MEAAKKKKEQTERTSTKRGCEEEMKRASGALSNWPSECNVGRKEKREEEENENPTAGKETRGRQEKQSEGWELNYKMIGWTPFTSLQKKTKRPQAKIKTIPSVSHNTEFSALGVPTSALPNSTKRSLPHPTWLQRSRTWCFISTSLQC